MARMGNLYLVRHGQASFGTDDYDRWANTKCFPEGVVPRLDICTSVTVRLRKGRAVWLEVSRIEAVC
jgi:broad specificity phosphatase PhoE